MIALTKEVKFILALWQNHIKEPKILIDLFSASVIIRSREHCEN